jgi:hypothetical protein
LQFRLTVGVGTYEELSLASKFELLWLADLRGSRGEGAGTRETAEDAAEAPELGPGAAGGKSKAEDEDSEVRGRCSFLEQSKSG